MKDKVASAPRWRPGQSQAVTLKPGTKRQITVADLRELVVDNFAGGGGASTGIALALGRSVDIAINHDPDAIAMHATNHPDTKHYCESVWDVKPLEATQGQPVGLCWLSPDCKHFSKAKGGKPVEKKIRGLAWVAVRWAATVHPRVIMLENVEEFVTWGPLIKGPDGKTLPDPKRKGREFWAFVHALQRHGYQVEWRELLACDYGAPTKRKRFFLIARCDGRPIVWPEPTHGDPKSEAVKSGRLKPWHTAAEIINWSLPTPSIFERKRPLKEATLRRIARGIQKFVVDNPKPFIIPVTHQGGPNRVVSLDEPFPTITAAHRGEHALIVPYIDRQFTRSTGHAADEPLGTVTAGGSGKANLVAAFLSQYHDSPHPRGQTVDRPLLTQDASNRFALVTSHLIKLRGTCAHGQPVTEPMPTITAGGFHIGEVRAFLIKYYGTNIGQGCDEPLQTITTKHRFGLVTVEGQDYQIGDIGMRMLEPRELFRGQGFPEDYVIDHDAEGRRYSKAVQVGRCGNAVPPHFAEALVLANVPEMCRENRTSA